MSASEPLRAAVGCRPSEALLATDNPQVCRLFAKLIRTAVPVASLRTTTTAKETAFAIGQARPELVLLDSELTQQSSIDLIHLASSARNHACVVILGSSGHCSRLISALQSGASACLIIEDPLEALTRQLQSILRGDLALSPSAVCAVFGQLRQLLPSVTQMSPLSTKEGEALKYVAAGMTLAEAAQRMGIRHATARTYLRRAYNKLGVSSRAQASRAAIALGLL